MRCSSVLADLGMLLIVYRILRPRDFPVLRPIVLLLALPPRIDYGVGVSRKHRAYHGCLLLLSIYLIDTRRADWLAGAAFGMA